MTAALLGYGAVFEIATENSPDSYVALAEVTNITPPSADVDQVDTTHMQSPGRYREFIDGLIDGGECSCEINFIPGNATDQRMFELLALPTGVTHARNCRISFANGVTWSFLGTLTGYEPDVPVDDRMTATITFKVSGAITRGAT
jgi:hypothetical protein